METTPFSFKCKSFISNIITSSSFEAYNVLYSMWPDLKNGEFCANHLMDGKYLLTWPCPLLHTGGQKWHLLASSGFSGLKWVWKIRLNLTFKKHTHIQIGWIIATVSNCFRLEETPLLLFCNRVCLLTAGDCLPTILSALPNQLENIERQNEPEERESKSISVKFSWTKWKREQLFRN